MAEYTAAASARQITLSAGVVDTVTLQTYLTQVEIATDGQSPIYLQFGSDAAPYVGDSDSWLLPAAYGSRTLPTHLSAHDIEANITVVRLISAGTPTYSVGESGFVDDPQVGIQGDQGEPGPPGPAGPPGPPAPAFEQNFADASDTWLIAHDLATYPEVTTRDLNGAEIHGAVSWPDTSTVIVSWAMPFAGVARLTA